LKSVRNPVRIIHLILILTISFSYLYSNKKSYTDSKDVLSVATGRFSNIFSPLYARSASDIFLCGICNELLLDYDRNGEIVLRGKSGETRRFNGTDYTYSGIADCIITNNGEYTDYAFDMREDVYFSDGVNMTADDVIFTMYVMADPSYIGVEQFYTLPILGMEEYRLVFSADIKEHYYEIADRISSEKDGETSGIDRDTLNVYAQSLEKAWRECNKLISEYCAGNFPDLLLQFGNSENALAMYGWGFCELGKDGVLRGIKSGKTWNINNGELPSEDDYFNESFAFYSGDAELFYSKALTGLTKETVLDKAKKYFAESIFSMSGNDNSVPNINGVTKNGKYSFTVRMTDDAVLNLYKLSFSILPLHYYGDRNLFDIENNRFGFERGNLEKIKSLNDSPCGAGPYVFKEYSDGVVSLVRNDKYYKGAPRIKNIALCEITSGDEVNEILSGNIDVASVTYDDDVSLILKSNSNKELSGDKIYSIETQILSYGYIGINAHRVKVGNDPASYESKSLRKAFSTILAVYRDIAVSSFFYSEAGCRADVIEYPIPIASWAYPNATEKDYTKAFSKDKDGESIYNSDMTENDRYDAALNAAIEYFIEAGYTYDSTEKVFRNAPDGAALKYTIIIPGGGNKAHPGYIVASMASDALKQIGITLEVFDLADTNSIWNKLASSECDMWSAAKSRGADPDLYQLYHSDSIPGNNGSEYNYHLICDERLDKLIEDAAKSNNNRKRKILYKECFDIIADWGVEVPMFSADMMNIFSAESVTVSSLVKDATSFYDWSKEIEIVELK